MAYCKTPGTLSKDKSVSKEDRVINPFCVVDYNLIVIGSSLEGLGCARTAAQSGAKVCVITDNEGVFDQLEINLFLQILFQSIWCGVSAQRHAPAYSRGPEFKGYKFDWGKLMTEIKRTVQSSLKEKIDQFKHDRISFIQGSPQFLNKNTITFEDDLDRVFWADNFVVAPFDGRKEGPQFPPIRGGDSVGISILGLMATEDLKGKILIVGSNSAAVQLAVILSTVVDITLMCREAPAFPYDQEMLEFYLGNTDVEFMKNCLVNLVIKHSSAKYEVRFTQLGKKWRSEGFYDEIIFMDDTQVSLKKYKLHNAGLHFTSRQINTNVNFQTNIKNIFALGTVTNNNYRNYYLPEQIGKNLAEFILGRKECVNDVTDKCGVLLGQQSYSFVGLSEEDAKDIYGESSIEVYQRVFKAHEYISDLFFIPINYLKVIVTRDDSEKILGMHFLGPHASEVMQGYAAAFRCGNLNVHTLTSFAGVYPSVAREFGEIRFTKRNERVMTEVMTLFTCCN